MPVPSEHANALRVLVVPPTRRDGEVTAGLLQKAGVATLVCLNLDALAAQIELGVGAIVMTDTTLLEPRMDVLLSSLARQPSWSEVPVVLLTRQRDHSSAAAKAQSMLGNVTLLDLPASTKSMVSAVQAALRARRRQYQIRDQIEQQRAAEEALREADRRKDEFLATLAHELRNPLAPIRTGLQALALVPGDGRQAEQLREMMARQLSQLVRLIDELLEVSRIATGKVVLRRERLDMRAVVQAALESSQPVIDAARHELRRELPGEPVWALGDASRLAQVISNLVNNAAKYTPAGGVVTVSVAIDGGDAVVRVVDSGAGIPPDMIEHVFDMFAQVDRTLDRAQGGLGIGLSLARRLMDLHGGSVTAESPGLNRGSTFTVRVPVLPVQRMAPTVAVGDALRAAVRPLKVLLVDDNVDAADSMAMLLSANGHDVRTEYSSASALEAAADFRPDVVLCDIGLPGMDGHEVALQLRADRRYASTVLVALTGWGTAEDKRRTRQAGFDFHLVKPVGLDAVNEILAKL